jgi:nucleotide-binding universal stress UspA family protein
VLGSVSKGVLNHAKHPVLVVRGSRVEAEAAV